MKSNPMDTRERSAFEIVAELRKHKRAQKVCVLGVHDINASKLAEVLPDALEDIVEADAFILTGCSPVGTEKAARLVAKKLTGRRAVVFHRAEMTYGVKAAEKMRDVLLAQEADMLIAVGKVTGHVRSRFIARGKSVHEIEIE